MNSLEKITLEEAVTMYEKEGIAMVIKDGKAVGISLEEK